jgi:hypothetical protein
MPPCVMMFSFDWKSERSLLVHVVAPWMDMVSYIYFTMKRLDHGEGKDIYGIAFCSR